MQKNTLVKCNNSEIIKNVESFNKRFNKLQKENKLNDIEFSRLTGISESKIEKLGIGKAIPTTEELVSLKLNFDVSIDWLLFGETCNNAQDDNSSLSIEEISILKKMAKKFNV